MQLIFLDIDGVLNWHQKLPGSMYSGITLALAGKFNRLLTSVPESKIVISSSWRYLILRGEMTLKGFEMLLQICGVNCRGRVIAHTIADGEIQDEPAHDDPEAWHLAGLAMRRGQILKMLEELKPTHFVVLDDLPLAGVPNLVQTDGQVGLTDRDVDRAIQMLSTTYDDVSVSC